MRDLRGIMMPNWHSSPSRWDAHSSGIRQHRIRNLISSSRTCSLNLQTLSKLSKNILDHPDEPKYHQFKSTNATIVRTREYRPGYMFIVEVLQH